MNVNISKLVCLSVLLLMTATGYPVVTLHGDPKNSKSCYDFEISVKGEIRSIDAENLKRAINFVQNKSKSRCDSGEIVVFVDSSGGDVSTAINMGRILRKHEALVNIQGECSSACVFLLAGAVIRVVDGGQVRIHRPYFSALEGGLSMKDIQSKRNALKREIESYFKEVNVSLSLLDAMLAVPPEEGRTLSKEELDGFHLSFKDATYDEKQVAKEAFRYGLTSSEYRKRKLEADQKCYPKTGEINLSDFGKRTNCIEGILMQVSEKESRRRRNLGYECIDTERNVVDETCMREAYTTGKLK